MFVNTIEGTTLCFPKGPSELSQCDGGFDKECQRPMIIYQPTNSAPRSRVLGQRAVLMSGKAI
jgi:hypothetical protein